MASQIEILDWDDEEDHQRATMLSELAAMRPVEVPEPVKPTPGRPYTAALSILRLARIEGNAVPFSRPVQPDAYALMADVEALNDLKAELDYAQRRIDVLRGRIVRRLEEDPFDGGSPLGEAHPDWALCPEVRLAASLARLILAETDRCGDAATQAASIVRWGNVARGIVADGGQESGAA